MGADSQKRSKPEALNSALASDATHRDLTPGADASVQRRDAAGLQASELRGILAGDSAPVQRKAVQMYAEEARADGNWRIGDNQTMAVRQDSPVYGGRHFYADSGLISSAAATLKGQGSPLEMTTGGGTMKVKTPSGGDRELSRVTPTNKSNKTSGNDRASGMKGPEDCGIAANTVMQGSGRSGKGVYTKEQKVDPSWLDLVIAFLTGGTAKGTTTSVDAETPGRHRSAGVFG